MRNFVINAIAIALNNPPNWELGLAVFLVLVAIELATGLTRRLLKRFGHIFFGRKGEVDKHSKDISQKIMILGSHNVVEGQTVNTEIDLQETKPPEVENLPHTKCEIKEIELDYFGSGLLFDFGSKCYFANTRKLTDYLSNCSATDTILVLTIDQLLGVLQLFKRFLPNSISIVATEDLKLAITRELESRNLSLEIETAVPLAKGIPFQKLTNTHFGINNRFLGIYIVRS